MKMKKSMYLLFMLQILFIPVFKAESKLTHEDMQYYTNGTNFNGSIVISRNNKEQGYDILYSDANGINGGYDVDYLYDIGSVSKVYTTIGIMKLEEMGKLDYNDPINKYLDSVPPDKSEITIEMLLTHTSGIYVSENSNHQVTKEEELTRILSSPLQFYPGTEFLYSNAGFTLLAAIIESVSGTTFENYMQTEIFDKYGLENTGFPCSSNLDKKNAVIGHLDGVTYGSVVDLDFGWYSKGYTDILTTPLDATKFFNLLISGKIVSDSNLKLLMTPVIQTDNNSYRGYGTDIENPYDSDSMYVGHVGVWYGGNTAIFYRPEDRVLFVLMCDSVVVEQDLPSLSVIYKLKAAYPTGSLEDMSSVEKISYYDPEVEYAEISAKVVNDDQYYRPDNQVTVDQDVLSSSTKTSELEEQPYAEEDASESKNKKVRDEQNASEIESSNDELLQIEIIGKIILICFLLSSGTFLLIKNISNLKKYIEVK